LICGLFCAIALIALFWPLFADITKTMTQKPRKLTFYEKSKLTCWLGLFNALKTTILLIGIGE